jgi:hypothetical protein
MGNTESVIEECLDLFENSGSIYGHIWVDDFLFYDFFVFSQFLDFLHFIFVLV